MLQENVEAVPYSRETQNSGALESQPHSVPGFCPQEVENERGVADLGAGTRKECWLGLDCAPRIVQGKGSSYFPVHEMWAIPEREPWCCWVILDLA